MSKNKKKKPYVRQIERGWPGHYICADKCQFRRNTLLQYNGVNIVVSTVGAQWVKDYLNGGRRYEKIGAGYYFETKVFHARYDGEYWDADVSREIFACPMRNRLYKMDQLSDKEANLMHDKIVGWYVNRLRRNCTFEIERDEYGVDITDWEKYYE